MEKTEAMKWGRQHHVKKVWEPKQFGTPLDFYQLLCFRRKNINKGGKIQHLTKGCTWPGLSLHKVILHGINLYINY